MWLCLLLPCLVVDALPFVTTWKTTTPSEVVIWVPICPQTALTISWGDGQSDQFQAGVNVTASHTYTIAGSYNVSASGTFRWRVRAPTPLVTTITKLVDIVSWGDGFIVDKDSRSLFLSFPNLRVSAPANTQPVFLPGANLANMFQYTAFNSPLNWDLTNVTDIDYMFGSTPVNQPIVFTNTQGVTTLEGLFFYAASFNQPFSFDCSSVTTLTSMFYAATSFNSPLTLTNTQKVTTTNTMFASASKFNQPVSFRTDSVGTMTSMFAFATKFNSPLDLLNTSSVVWLSSMFEGASSFDQPINFQASRLRLVDKMFRNALSFNQPITMDTSAVTSMQGMFDGATSFASTLNFSSTTNVIDMRSMFSNASYFEQDLAQWDTSNVTNCTDFCSWCGLPSFPLCTPCVERFTVAAKSVCYNTTRAPSPPTTRTPTRAPNSPASSPSSSSAPSAPSSPTSAVAAGVSAVEPAMMLMGGIFFGCDFVLTKS